MKRIIICVLLLILTEMGYGQVGINSNGTTPDPSAMLDVKSNTKGMLIPRMTTVERQTIVDPAQGLMVYDQNNNAFYYFNGIGWLELLSGTVTELKDANGDTKIQVEETVDDDIIRFDIEGVERVKIVENRIEVVNNDDNIFIGEDAGNTSLTKWNNIGIGTETLDSLTNGYSNIALGDETLKSTTSGINNFGAGYRVMTHNKTGQANVAIGYENLFKNISGRDNVALGYYVLHENTSGSHNIGLGNFAIQSNTTGNYNMGIGNFAIESNTTGSNNSALGNLALLYNETGSHNTSIGHESMYNNISGNENTALGYYADVLSPDLRKATAIGAFANVDCDNCLVLGEVDSIRVGIGTSTPEEKLHVVGSMKLVDGNQQDGYILTSDADGKASWQSLGSVGDNQELAFDGTNLSIEDGNSVVISTSNIADNDGDTKIQVEESTDEDVIRFDILGFEAMTLKKVGTFNPIVQLAFPSSGSDIFIGNGVGESIIERSGSTAIGDQAFVSNEHGSSNVAFGNYSLHNNVDGGFNSAIGSNSLRNNIAYSNTGVGSKSLFENTEGENNVGLGESAGYGNQLGNNNVLIGKSAGGRETQHNKSNNVMVGHESGLNTLGSSNVFLGNQSGKNETGDQKLYIDNTATAAPLIYGEFDNNLVRVNGDLEVTGDFPGKTILQDADGDTKIQVEESTNEDIIRFDLRGEESLIINKNDNLDDQLIFSNSASDIDSLNIFIGDTLSGKVNTGIRNIGIGGQALAKNTIGDNNLALGHRALFDNKRGDKNIAFGIDALQNNFSGSSNIAIGYFTGGQNSSGDRNVLIGESAGRGTEDHDKNNNVMIGFQAGLNNEGNSNVFLGSAAGAFEMGSDRLYIENTSSATPLIYGEFDNNLVRINGDLEVTGTIPTNTLISDTDGDTKIQVEEGSDDDIIRFDIEGTETMTLKKVGNNNSVQLELNSGEANTLIGNGVAENLTTGTDNTSVGSLSLHTNTSGSLNTSLGAYTLANNSSGVGNVAIGAYALTENTEGYHNVVIGVSADASNENGNSNVLLGAFAGINGLSHSKNQNVMIGHSAGQSNEGDGNVFLGYHAGSGSSGSNLLYIENTDSTSPLIYGEFDNDLLRVNGTLNINNSFSLPTTDGSSNQILQTDGSGTLTWGEKTSNTDNQTVSFDGTDLTISNGNSVDISGVDTDTDDQTLSFNTGNNVLSISEGNTVNLSELDKDQQTLSYDDDTQSLSISGGNTLDLTQLAVPIGTIMMWYTATPPDGWLICEGSNTPAQYTDLINLIGNQLPDLEGRFVLGAGERNEGSNHPLLQTGGIEDVVLQEANIPAHSHSVTIGFREGEEQGSGTDYSDLGAPSTQHNSSGTYTSSNWGGSANGPTLAHENMPPFLTLHYIIKAK